MKIQWLGHSAFKLEESTGTVIVTDPFEESAVGYAMQSVKADAVTVSHQHTDHNAVNLVTGNPIVIDKPGAYDVKGVHISAIEEYHDAYQGRDRGMNLIFKYRLDGVDVVHMGDIGEQCSIEMSENIGSVNILIIPVGGNYTIDAEAAKEYIDLLMPDIAIPMHYKTRETELDVDRVEQFLKLFDDEQICYIDKEAEFDRVDFEGEDTKILVFNK